MTEADEKRREWLAHKAELARARRAKKKARAETEGRELAAIASGPKSPRSADPLKVTPVSAPVAAKLTKFIKARADAAPVRTGRGGARVGAGRKPKHGEERMRSVTFRATAAQHAEFVRLGGADWLRTSLNRSISREAKKS